MPNVRCSGCRQKVSVPDAYVGRAVKCPKCKEPMWVGAVADAGVAAGTAHAGSADVAPTSAARRSPEAASTVACATPPAATTPADKVLTPPPPDKPREPLPILPPLAFAKTFPKAAALIALVFGWAAIAVLVAMAQAFVGAGGLALATLAAGGGHVALGIGLYRRRDWSWPTTVGVSALMILVLAATVADGAALLILPLVVSAGILALCFAEPQAFRRPSFNLAGTPRQPLVGTGLSGGTAAAPAIPLPAAPPAATTPSGANAEAAKVANAATNCRLLFRMSLAALAGVGLIVALHYAGWLPAGTAEKRYRSPSVADYVAGFATTGFSLVIWGGAAFAAVYLPLRWQTIAALPTPVRRRGQAGGVGLIGIAALSLATMFIDPAGLLPTRGGDGPSFAEVDATFGAASVTNGRASERLLKMTAAQRQAQVERFVGRPVRWQGRVVDVSGAVVILQDPALPNIVELMAMNQIAVKFDDRDAGRLVGLGKGQLVEFSGVLSAIGEPYPYYIRDGRLR